MEGKHICILGCGRSGTSIFGELFQSLTPYRYYSEPEWQAFSSIGFGSPVAVKVPRPPANGSTSPGLPFLLSDFEKIFPSNGVIFWQVRHPLDAICSLRVGISKDWGHHPRPPDYLNWSSKPLVERCAYHWNYINTVGYQQIKHVAIVNKFEDMIRSPLETAKDCLEKAGIDVTAHLDEIEGWAERVQDENNHKFSEADCSKSYSRNDHTRKVNRWKENMTRIELRQVLPIIREGSEYFKYF